MNGFMHWFRSSTKMKRWILLLVVGIILACYGMARILVAKTFDFKEIAIIIGIFVIGFVFVILGIIIGISGVIFNKGILKDFFELE